MLQDGRLYKILTTNVVLLILKGITIQLLINDGGIFSQVQRSKEQTRIGELLDKFNVLEATVALEKLGKQQKFKMQEKLQIFRLKSGLL